MVLLAEVLHIKLYFLVSNVVHLGASLITFLHNCFAARIKTQALLSWQCIDRANENSPVGTEEGISSAMPVAQASVGKRWPDPLHPPTPTLFSTQRCLGALLFEGLLQI